MIRSQHALQNQSFSKMIQHVVLALLVFFGSAAILNRADASFATFRTEMAPHAAPYAVKTHKSEPETLRFELRAGDCALELDCNTERERIEIKEDWRPPLDKVVWYRFSLFLPEDYPEMSPKQILGQWHDGKRPALSNRYMDGRFWVDLMSGASRTTHKFEIADFEKGRWQSFTYAIRWSHSSNGWLRIWHNDNLMTFYRGATLSADWTKPPRFKIGIYRSHLDRRGGVPSPTQVAYVKGYVRSVELPPGPVTKIDFPSKDLLFDIGKFRSR